MLHDRHLSAPPSLILGTTAIHSARKRHFSGISLGHAIPDAAELPSLVSVIVTPTPMPAWALFIVRGSHPRRSVCDDVAGEALDATRLWRVLHCVPVPARRKRRLECLRPLARHQSRTPAGERPPPEQRKGLLTWLLSDP
jgi:hypothetical protein